MKNIFIFLCFALLFQTPLCLGASKAKTSKTKAEKKVVQPQETRPTPTQTSDFIITQPVWTRYRLNSMVGINIVQGSALVAGMQFGYALQPGSPLYVGPEFNFSLFSPGSIFSLMAGGWYEMRVKGAPKMSISIGALAGPAFSSGVTDLGVTSLAAYADLTLAQEIDDLVTIRGQLRPGMVGKFFAFMMNFSVGFRFI